MEDHPSSILDWPYLSREKSIEELTQSLWLTTMELEATRVRVQEEIRARDDQLNQLNDLLIDAINERNEARNKYQSLLLDKLLLQQQFHQQNKTTTTPPQSGDSTVEDEPITNYGFSLSDCEESIVSSPPVETAVQLLPPTKGLPEKGKFLEAVMKAGPLLQNLLLAGPLPLWRHPPPALDTYQIPSPPLLISAQPLHYLLRQESLRSLADNCFEFNKKRGFSEDSDSSTETKYQRISRN
ncbi:hypothetical protein L1987_34639 [Smallanthus sonchifolius]|uniref:Uncharacterized protein n=1 Tax=Smallanthus sonchifolius TaxID=185202 RepID=A0ACB9HVW7_9ASTR|nr:hypothetical protein L1987_34639 [Smallanthus sonchifolius]